MFGQASAIYKLLKNKQGQLAVEYILLVMIAVIVATTIVSLMVSRNPDEPGFLISAWQEIVRIISSDQAGEPVP